MPRGTSQSINTLLLHPNGRNRRLKKNVQVQVQVHSRRNQASKKEKKKKKKRVRKHDRKEENFYFLKITNKTPTNKQTAAA
jgi:hypothetical protein